MHTQRIAQCGPAPSCNFPRPASTGSMCQDWAMERSRSINCPGLSLDIIALHGGVRVICCARCPRCPRGHAPLFSGGVAAFSVRRGEQGRSWGLVTGGPGGIKRSRVTEHHPGGGVSSCHRVHHLPDFAYIKCILQSISPDKLLYCLL